MFNEMIVVSVTPFSGTTTPDKNGKMPVMLQCIAGRMPNRNVLSGTVAERAGFEVGRTYVAQVRQRGTDSVFGEDFTFLMVKELTTGKDIAETVEKIGPVDIMLVDKPNGFESTYHRKGDAVEGLQTKRAKDGNYEFAISRVVTHNTAKKLIAGSTITGATEEQLNLSPEDLEKRSRKEPPLKV